MWFPLLLCARRAQRQFPPVMHGHPSALSGRAARSKAVFYQLSDPSSGITAFIPVMATSIMESSGSKVVKF